MGVESLTCVPLKFNSETTSRARSETMAPFEGAKYAVLLFYYSNA